MRQDRGFTGGEVVVLAVASIVIMALTVSGIATNNPGSGRTICASHIRDMIMSMTVYAQMSNKSFPSVMLPSKAGSFENKIFTHDGKRAKRIHTAGRLLAAYFPPKKKQQAAPLHRASPSACMWLMVATGKMTSRSFICPGDPLMAGEAPSLLIRKGKAKAANYCWDNFGRDKRGQLLPGGGESYSIADPWRGTRLAAYWSHNSNPAVPLASDIAPAVDLKAPARLKRDPAAANFTQHGAALFNSGNHNGTGQNVGFADGHVSFNINPFCGENNDNIFTWNGNAKLAHRTGGKVPTLGKTAVGPRKVHERRGHIDTVMVPVRDITTGGT